jgi:putative transposase
MEKRKEFVLKALSRSASITQLCDEYGISRKTGYKWIARFKQQGFDGLVDETRRPNGSPLETTAELTLEIIRQRQLHPTWGARKIQRVIERGLKPDAKAPSERTVGRVLKRSRLVKQRRKLRRPDYGLSLEAPQVVVAAPNDLWTADFKGWWCAGDGARCEPLTVRDAFSRFVFTLKLMDRKREQEVWAVFEDLFKRYGLPKAIQTDNGPPFATTKSLCGLTQLSARWVALGIKLVRSRPGCPQDNGAHERMHADMRFELEDAAADSVVAQQAACDAWRLEFNHVRPHDALGLKTPAEVYRPSERKMRSVVIGAGFPEGCQTVQLNNRGGFPWLGQQIFVTRALARMHVGLEHRDQEIRVWFHELLLGSFTLGQPGKEISVQPFRPAALAGADTAAPAKHDAAKELAKTSPPAFHTASGTASPFPVDSRCAPAHREAPAASDGRCQEINVTQNTD